MDEFFDFPIYKMDITENEVDTANSYEKRKVLILVNKDQYNENQQIFLFKILNSIQLDIKNDCNIIKLSDDNKMEFYKLISRFGSDHILSFGIKPEQFSSQAILKTRIWNKFESFSILIMENLDMIEKSQDLKNIVGQHKNIEKMIKTKLVFATDNQNKVEEINKLLPEDFKYEIITKREAGILEEIIENGYTILENAKIKSDYIKGKYGLNCFSEDTGLFVEALNGDPGVYSARYSGTDHNSERNIDLLLDNLKGKTNRKAYFKTVISLNINNRQFYFEGIVKGNILKHRFGEKGFGYDPIFQPDNYSISFAQMDKSTKNQISHRGKAVRKLIDFLMSYNFE